MGRAMYGLRLPFQIILISLIGQLRSAGRPVVTFDPDSNKILVGQSITMTCNVEPPASHYHWYRNNIELYTRGKTITFSAWTGNIRDYKCRTSTGDTSEVVTLSVMDGPVILQAPLYVYEGDNISLQCFSPSKAQATQTIFYRNNQTVQESTTDYDRLAVNYTELTATYKCSKQVLTTITKRYSADTTISYTENTGTIPVTLKPNWNKLLTGDNITMICYEGYTHPLTYHWFKNGDILVSEEQTYTITSAQVGHSGIYRCRTNGGESLPFTLEVSDGPLVLQAPIFVYRRRDINLNCHSRPEYSVLTIIYYKGNNVILRTSSDHPFLVLNGIYDVSGRYRCEKVLSRDEYVTYTDEVSLHVRDLFSEPNITTMLYPATEGDNMTLTCDTGLSPLRQGTQLQFAFYRDGQEVREFSSSHQYEVQSAQPKDSGNYSCKVRTPNNSVMKSSEGVYIEIQGAKSNNANATSTQDIVLILLSILLLLLITTIVIIVVIKYRRKPSPKSTKTAMEPPDAESSRVFSQEEDANYAKVNFKKKEPEPTTNSNSDEDVCYAKLTISQKVSLPRATEDQVVYSEIKARTEI